MCDARDVRAMRRRSKPKPRRRRGAEAARALILDAAAKRLAEAGPSGIRLQEVAADAGVSHPTVLHHFGSRERLVKAVIERSLRAINESLVDAIRTSSGDEAELEALIENVARALDESGHARVTLWLALEGAPIDAEGSLGDVVDAVHALRVARAEGPPPAREETARFVVLATLALVCGAVLAPALLENAGLGADARDPTRFRRWLARLLLEHLAPGTPV
jgi:AcrR family transcriptional regulator